MEELFDTLVVVVVGIPVGAALLLVAGLYGAEVVRKVWRRR